MTDRKPKEGDVTAEEQFALRRSSELLVESLRLSWTDRAGPNSAVVSERVVVGSAEQAQIVIRDATVSRVHAELDPRPDGLWVRDLGSKNGTFVNGVFIQTARLTSEREIRLGSLVLTITPDTQPSTSQPWIGDSFGPLLGKSKSMRRLFASLARIAATEFSVLVQGETGTGKELVARAIHDASARKSGPFVVVDCAAIPESLFESQLFGHTRGAFTGAHVARTGDVEAASGGTLFLDEVGELPLASQPKLLRMLESRTIKRVGETQVRPVDVRLVSATHRDLLAMVNAGTFREDLYFRLAAVPVAVPALRDRPDDIPLLARRFLGPSHDGVLPAELIAQLGSRGWSGNVRELRNFVERALALGVGEALALQRADAARGSSPAEPVANVTASAPAPTTPGASGTPGSALPPNPFARVPLDQVYRDFREQWLDHGERIYLEKLLEAHGGNVALAAEHAGLDRTHVYRLLRKHRG